MTAYTPPLTGPLLVLQLNNHMMDLQRLIRNLNPQSTSELELIASRANCITELAGDTAMCMTLQEEEVGAL